MYKPLPRPSEKEILEVLGMADTDNRQENTVVMNRENN